MSWLYETPWWLPAALAVVGVALFVASNNRQDPRGRLVGMILVCLALLLGVSSYFLESDREIVTRRGRELVQAVASGDPKHISPYLDPDFSLPGLHGREASVARIQDMVQSRHISATTTSVDTQLEGADEAFSILQVYINADKEGAFPTRWKLRWQKEGKDWLLTDVTPLEIPSIGVPNLSDLIKMFR